MGADARYAAPWIALVVGLLTSLVGGCQGQPPALSLAVNPWPGFAYFALAQSRELYDRRRISLEITSFDDPARQMEAYVSGRVQAIATTLVDVVTLCGVAPERCPVIVYVIDESSGADQLLAPRGVHDLAALVGRPIALERSSLSRYLLARAFESRGLPPPSAAQLRFTPPSTWAAALREGKVEAVVSYPPGSEKLHRALPLETLFTSRELPHEILDVLAVEPEFLRQHPDAVAALVRGWQTVRAEENTRPLTIRREVARELGLAPDGGEDPVGRIRYPGPQEQYELLAPRQNNLPPVMERIRRVLYANGLIPANTPLPATQHALL